ncbi:MAG: hypothetical protein ACFFER_07505 [Candidatus Thorarchaeota archaeon]
MVIQVEYGRKALNVAVGIPELIACATTRLQNGYSITEVLSMIEAAFIRTHQSAEITLKAACAKHGYLGFTAYPFPSFKTILRRSRCRRIVDSSLLDSVNDARNSVQHKSLPLYSVMSDEGIEPFHTMISTLENIKLIFQEFSELGVDSSEIDAILSQMSLQSHSFRNEIRNVTTQDYDDWRSAF